MSDEATGKSGKVWLWVGALALGLPTCYVLSIGPAAVLYHRGNIPHQPCLAFYRHLVKLAEPSSQLHRLINAYIESWLAMTGTKEIW